MTDFSDLRARISRTRAQLAQAADQLALQRAQLKSIQRQIATLQRLDGGKGSHRELLAALQKQQDELSAQVDQQQKQKANFRDGVGQLVSQLTRLEDPTKQIEQLDDSIPILLFPVRLEVRFHTTEIPVGESPELWIRIYPDDCHIDTFEQILTDTEIQNLTSFWIAMWRAGKVEAQERGAWAALVGSSSSGRSAYLITQYAPANPSDKPTKANPQDVILVIVPQVVLTAAEQITAFAYWTSVWGADGNQIKEQAALSTLRASVGNARADDIVTNFAPDLNGWAPPTPYTRDQVTVSCAVLKLPAAPPSKQSSWTQAPQVIGLPDRFVALLYSGTQLQTVIGGPVRDPLAASIDPSLPSGEQINVTDDDLKLNDGLRWMVDFQEAVGAGMGIKVSLTPQQAQAGFDRLLVVGLRISSDEKESKALIESLIADQYASKGGYSLVPQGSPTNNTSSDGSAYTWVDDPDSAYDTVFKGTDAYVESNDPLQRRDGQWLAEALGINGALIKKIPNAAGMDQMEARAMNIALWNGTLGYMMEEMLTPVFSRADIGATRLFFTRYVAGRGPLPAIRVGNQPYGILPVTAFSRYAPPPERGVIALPQASSSYLQRLHALLLRMDKDWAAMTADVPCVGRGSNPEQTLLDIVGLHSGVVEYHQRYAESFDQLYNKLTLEYGQAYGALLAQWMRIRSQATLAALGGDASLQPPILEKFFYGPSSLLTGPLVDDSPLSETKPIREYTPDKKNYIEWLASVSLDTIRQQDFGGNPEPTALLYLMLRHSMMLGQWDAGTRFLEAHALVDPAVARVEPSFINVQTAANTGQSKFQHLYEPQPAITGSATQTLAEYILLPGIVSTAPETEDLREIQGALALLADSPTARLERIFAEHIDCCSYRLDAWKTAFATIRLAEMRAGDETPRTGIYLGAFGWLEHVSPKLDRLITPQLDNGLAKVFQRPGDAPLKYDSQNAGYIHAPSLNQAAAAAILKNAYRTHASAAKPDAMAVNLSSQRVRQAQNILEGIRNGQTLSALLGYRFERGLHDDYAIAEVDKFIYPLRRAFPLVADKLKSTQSAPETDITLLEARNVLDGVLLVNAMRTSSATYPFGLTVGIDVGQVPEASPDEAAAINTEADRLLNLYDALGDLVMAESVYQVVLGNFDRSAAVTKAFSEGAYPPDIQVLNTQRSGISLTHRIGLHFDPSVDPSVSPNTAPMTPRAQAEAPLNDWINSRLPDPADVVASVDYSTPALAAKKTVLVSQKDLGLQSIDLIYLLNLDLDQAMSELDDRIVQKVRYGADAHPAMDITINYTLPVTNKITFFELAALIKSLRSVVLKSRALRPSDMAMPLESTTDDVIFDDEELLTRVQAAITGLTAHRDKLVALETDASDLDTYAKSAAVELLQTALYGIPQTGTGQFQQDIHSIYSATNAKIRTLVDRWTTKASDYATRIAKYPTLTTDDDRFALLRQMERLIAPQLTLTPPADPNVYKTSIATLKGQFDTHLSQFQTLFTWSGTKLVDFVTAVDAMKAVAAQHDIVPFEIDDQETAVDTLRATIVAKVTSLANDLSQRIGDATKILTSIPGDASSEETVQSLVAAAKRVLGSEMQIVPRFKLSADHAAEFDNAWNSSAALLTDLKINGRVFPVDDWLYGIARVRDKVGAWENVVMLSEAFGQTTADLIPVQLPFVSGDRWTALEFDTANATSNTRLLYTSHFTVPFSSAADQCGLLIDEWPELVPSPDVMSGVTFHFDRPNSQPPQTMLLAVPPVRRGNWNWDDLISTLNDVYIDAQKRAVEPAQIDASNYAQFLPATLMAVTLYQITLSTNLALNNHIYRVMGSQ